MLKAQQEEEEPDEPTLRLHPYTELDTAVEQQVCLPLSRVLSAHVLNFESQSRLYFQLSDAENVLVEGQLLFRDKETGAQLYRTVSQVGNYFAVNLPLNSTFELLLPTDCQDLFSVYEFSTVPKSSDELISISETLWKALSEWRNQTDTTIFDYLRNYEGLSEVEKYEFYQNFVKDGELLSDMYFNASLIPDEAFFPELSGGQECKCRILKINMINDVRAGIKDDDNGFIFPKVLSNDVTDVHPRVKFWERGSCMGPARYLQVWGETHRCFNRTETYYWGKRGEPQYGRMGFVRLTVGQSCLDGDFTPGTCYCAHNISIEYYYEAQYDARSATRGGACFNFPGKKSFAALEDVVIFLVDRGDSLSIALATDSLPAPLHFRASYTGLLSTCSYDFQEKRILDLLNTGFTIYGMAKGIPDIGDPTLDPIAGFLYGEYLKSGLKSRLESLLTQPWVVGECSQRSASNLFFGSYRGVLEGTTPLNIVLLAKSNLEVGGITAWDATARVISSYNVSLYIEKNEVDDTENAYCCTKPAGIYSLAGIEPLYTRAPLRRSVGGHLAFGLSCCYPTVNGRVVIENDFGTIIGRDIPNCRTVINDRNTDKTENWATLLRPYFGVNGLVVDGLPANQTFTAELISTDGRIIGRENLSQTEPLIFRGLLSPRISGVYFLRIYNKNTSITKKIIR